MKHLVVVGTCIIYILCLSSQQVNAASSDYSYLGCYKDGEPMIFPTLRKLLQQHLNFPDFCHHFCVMGKYPFFGLKNGKECWCSMSLDLILSHVGAAAECDKPCSGDASTMCGGAEAMDIYYTQSTTVSLCPSGDSLSNCGATSGTVCTSGYDCTYPLANANVQNGVGVCCPAVAVASTTTGIPETTTTSLDVTIPVTSGYMHLGCYGDGTHTIIPTTRKKLNQQQNTPDSCHDYCLMAKYAFFALKKGTQCWCIMNLALTTFPLSAGSCDSPCSGDSSLVCGGGSALDIYQSQSSQVSRCQYGGPSGHCGVAVGKQCSPSYQCNTDVHGQAGVCCPTPPFWYQGCFSSGDMLKNSKETYGYYTHQTCYNFCKPPGYLYFGLRGYSCYCGSDTSLLGMSTGMGEAVCSYQTTTYSVYEIPTAGCPSRDSLPPAFSQESCTIGRQCLPGAGIKQTCCPTWAGGSVCWPPVGVIQMPNQCDAKYPVIQNHMFASVDPLEMRRCDSTANCIVDTSTQLTLRGQSGIFTSTVASMGLKWAFTVTEATYVAEFEVLRMCTSVRGVDRVIIEYSTPTGDMNQMQILIFNPTLTTEVCSSRPFGVVDWVKFFYDAAEQNTVNNSPIEISSTSLEYCVKTLI